jgi:hypothetical protein
MVKHVIRIIIVSVVFMLGSCGNQRTPPWKVIVLWVSFVDSVKDLTNPGARAFAKEGHRFLLVRIKLENLLDRKNSFSLKEVFVVDSAGAKYNIVGTVNKNNYEGAEVLLGFTVSDDGKDVRSVGPRKVEDRPEFTNFIFVLPKTSSGWTFHFPGVLPINITPDTP